MSPRAGAPCAHAIISANKILAREGGVIAVCPPLDQLAVDLGPAVAALVVRAEGVAERSRRGREKGRGEGPRRTLGEEGDARLESVGEPGRGRRYGPGRVLLAYVPVVVLPVRLFCVAQVAAGVRGLCGVEGGC